MLYIRFLELTLITESCTLWLASPHFPHPSTPGSHHSTIHTFLCMMYIFSLLLNSQLCILNFYLWSMYLKGSILDLFLVLGEKLKPFTIGYDISCCVCIVWYTVYVVWYRCSYMVFIMWGMFPSLPSLFVFLSWKSVEFHQTQTFYKLFMH